MEALRSLSTKLATIHREKVVHALLLGSMVAIGFRSDEQQKEIESLEAEKAALRASNTAASTAMWSWREELFRLAESDSRIISASRIRAIYGEEEPTLATSSPSIDATGTSGNVTTEPVLVS
ncbi:hypothetical protein FCM35_KLT00181 [Carex littledalei]|uniref:Uncharacterized protein n=1 Tax=Carex littledalei TaxID=544730 RepID=A0A833RVU7_9POAL|nr:hypothetical protein FCM35_KLT00181 [Carex littledalei]